MIQIPISESDSSTLIAHFHRSKAEAYRDIIHEIDREFRLAINTWMADPTANVIGDKMLTQLFTGMGCEAEEYDKEFGLYRIYLPSSEWVQ